VQFGKTLTKLKAEKRYTNIEIADACGVTEGAIRTWLNGDKMPTADKIVKLSEFFGVSADYILNGQENPAAVSDSGDALDAKIMRTVRQLTPENKRKLIDRLEFLLQFQEHEPDSRE